MKFLSKLLILTLFATSAHASYIKPKIPTLQRFTTAGSTAGWVFTASGAGTHTANVGATYTNNGNTYTVLATFSGLVGVRFWASNSSAPSTPTGTLTKASGTGDSTINYTVAPVAFANYTVPTPAPLYLRLKLVAGGSGGSGGGTTTANGTAGTFSSFGAASVVANGGAAGGAAPSTSFEANTLTNAWTVHGQAGSNFTFSPAPGTTGFVPIEPGSAGCSTPLGGAGIYGDTTSGATATVNTGSGGGGGGYANPSTGGTAGHGGSCGTYQEGMILNPVAGATYPYVVGTKGTGGASASNGGSGGDGSDGLIEVWQHYQ